MRMTDEQRAKWVRLRRGWEKSIANRIIRAALKAGYSVSVWNGGDEAEISKGTKFRQVSEACLASDEDRLVFFNAAGQRVGWVWLVYGNSGWDTIADNTDNEATNAVLQDATAYAESLADKVPAWVTY